MGKTMAHSVFTSESFSTHWNEYNKSTDASTQDPTSRPLLHTIEETLPSFSKPSSAATNCSSVLEILDWSDGGFLATLLALSMVNILVLAGNTLVIVAVFYTQKLRTVTNFFIVSLAVADMSLGMLVLPFSISVEVFETWVFGRLWCSVWLAIDVWVSTASIFNLCAISLDRCGVRR